MGREGCGGEGEAAVFCELWSLAVCSGLSLDVGMLMGMWPGP